MPAALVSKRTLKPVPLPERRAAAKVTVATLAGLKRRDVRAVFITAYDYATATFAERAGVDMILVGDSAGMTMMGLPNTLGVTLSDMLVFVNSVCRATRRAFVVGDLPFLSYQPSDAAAVRSAGLFVRAGCDAVKCEGGARVARRVRAMTDAGMLVMGHIGLTPQSLAQQGGYRVQGTSRGAADRLVEDALALQDAGAFAVLLEAMPAETAAYIRDRVSMLVYGIGAGPQVDGQLMISHDMLGTFVGDVAPRFAKRYAEIGAAIESAFRAYASDVRDGVFPGPEHCYPLDPALAALLQPPVADVGTHIS
jgi:3-methyl-2-oxobutanoate hydroxymethyltransferase